MKFGLIFANLGPWAGGDGAVRMARAAEAAGFESIWAVEHVVVPSGYVSTYPYDRSGRMPGSDDSPIPDPLIWLTYLAAATSTIKLATGVLILPQRNPLVLAKEVATLDHLCGGRVLLGVGIGWLKEEFEALGVPFQDRAQRTEDAIGAMRALWREPEASYEGALTSFDRAILRPQPPRLGVPVHIGGHSKHAAERAGRLGDGFFPAVADHQRLAELFGAARASAEEAGRDPGELELTTGGRVPYGEHALEEIGALDELGVDRVVLPAFLFWKDPEEALARYGEEIIAASAGG